MKKQIVLEFNIDQSLTWDEAVISAREASKAAQLTIDTVMGRTGNGRGSAAGEVTIRWYGFDSQRIKSVNGGQIKFYGPRKYDSDADYNEQ